MLCFLLQTTVFVHIELIGIIPNLLVAVTCIAGFMYGREAGMFAGFICGFLFDFMYNDIIGVCIMIYVIIGYINGAVNKFYFKETTTIPLIAVAISDVAYGIMYFIFKFLLRGRLDLPVYLVQIIFPEVIYTTIIGLILYKFMRWLDNKLYPPAKVPLGNR